MNAEDILQAAQAAGMLVDCGVWQGRTAQVHAFCEAVSMIALRDYFIAHAPAEPWEHFEPTMPPKPERPGERPATLDLQNPGRRVETDETRQHDLAAQQFNTDMCEWTNEAARQRCIQWPAAWADAMLKARKAHG